MNQKQLPIEITLKENLVVITFGVKYAHYLFWETERLLGRFGDYEDRITMKAKEFMDFLQEESETPIAISGSAEQMIKRVEKAWAKILIALEQKLGESYQQLEEIARKGGKESNWKGGGVLPERITKKIFSLFSFFLSSIVPFFPLDNSSIVSRSGASSRFP